MKIGIIGLGWFGSELARNLQQQHFIYGSTRDEKKVENFRKLAITASLLLPPSSPSQELMNCECLILNIPPFKEQLEWFKSWPWNPKTHLIFISSTSVYGQLEQVTEEDTALPDSENAKILLRQEEWARSFPAHCIIRFGGLIGPNRHPAKTLSGRKALAGGNAPVNLIHLQDAVGFTRQVAENRICGLFNLVYPQHPTRREYYTQYCRQEGLALPEFEDSPGPFKQVDSIRVKSIYKMKKGLT